jgi:hypothetical protein
MYTALLPMIYFALAQSGEPFFTIKVVDGQTGRGVPAIELRTVDEAKYYTDSNGVVAYREPGLMGQVVFFHVVGQGYEYPKDGFGNRGKTLHTTPGESVTLTLRRLNIAERLYRVTGAGIYRDSVLAKVPVPLKEPLLNARVCGQDSVLTAVYKGKLYWFWGDTSRPGYPLGNFQVTGATSELPGHGGLDPDRGVDLTYFCNTDGFVKPMAPMPGDGLTWLVSLATLPDSTGRERLYAGYVKVHPPLKAYARGLAIFDDDKQQFVRAGDVSMSAAAFPSGHAFRHSEAGIDYVYFAGPYPLTRVRARGADFLNVGEYECFTPLAEGSSLDAPRLARNAEGRLDYAWRKNTPAVGPAEEKKLLSSGRIKLGEVRWRLRDREGRSVIPHAGSVNWNEHRRRWVMIAVQSGGTSFLGEVWYAEADSPTGPWNDAVKIVSHDRYSFYNPKQHPQFDKDNGRVIYFEGTFSQTFSGNPTPTPRYDYNQIMYKLDLADPRMGLPPR